MKRWNDISLFKFQEVSRLKDRKDLTMEDKALFGVCIVFAMTEHQLDNTNLRKVQKLLQRFTKIWDSPFEPVVKKRIGKYSMRYDVGEMTFGQYIELSHFLSQDPIYNGHLIAASVSYNWRGKNISDHHAKKAAYFLTQPVTEVLGAGKAIKESFKVLNSQYSSLFGLDPSVHGTSAQSDQFNKRYGWIYSAGQVAEYERITLEQAYGLPVRQAFHDLVYLKAKNKYEVELLDNAKQNPSNA